MVDGVLEAVGTATDGISFIGEEWQGIGTEDKGWVRMEYCMVEGAGERRWIRCGMGGYLDHDMTLDVNLDLIDDLAVAPGSTLTIKPEIVVQAIGDYYLYVEGTLQAVGTATDSIKFTTNDSIKALNQGGRISVDGGRACKFV